MNILSKTAAMCLALSLQITPAIADPIRKIYVRSHPSQGEVIQIKGATAALITGEQGVFINMNTKGLEPGHVYTLWLVVMNEPDKCSALPCTPKEVLKRSDIVKSDVAYAGGAIADISGKATFSHHQPLGQFKSGFFDNGLTNIDGGEFHLVVNDHGPLIKNRAIEMLTTYRGGCTDESIPVLMPDTARALGKKGPNQCRLVQFAQFLPSKPAS